MWYLVTFGCLERHHNQWVAAYSRDKEMQLILNFVKHPGSITNAALTASGINFNFRNALRQSHIVLENDILIYRKPIDWFGILCTPPAGALRVLQYPFRCIPQQPHGRPLQHLPHPTPPPASFLLARNVQIHIAHVQRLPRIRPFKSNTVSVVRIMMIVT